MRREIGWSLLSSFIHVGAVLFILTLMTMAAVFNHCGWEIFPKWWLRGLPGRHLITAAHHDLHHKNPRTNYGLYFRFWDKLMGTDVMESEYEFLAPRRVEPEPGRVSWARFPGRNPE